MDFFRTIRTYVIPGLLCLVQFWGSSLHAQSDFKESLTIDENSGLYPGKGKGIFRVVDGKSLLHFNEAEIVRRIGEDQFIIKTKSFDAEEVESELFLQDYDWKCTPRILSALGSKRNEQLTVQLKISEADKFEKLYKSYGERINFLNIDGIYVRIKADVDVLRDILSSDLVLFADVSEKNPFTETRINYLDLSVNKINLVQHEFPDLNGEGMLVSLKEQQFDFNDIDLRNRNIVSGLENEEIDDHATQMATIIGGAGNSSELGRGVVPRVSFGSTSFDNLFPDDEDYYLQNGVVVQNHSYGIEPEQFYSLEAEAYDRFVNNNSNILHVFSSGNRGQESGEGGIYDGIQSFATLTGGFKMAKNVLVVGALDRFESIPSISSRGPAYDGRVKPELVAYAGAGSSDAAAITSGVATMLQQAYFKEHEEYPSSALVKSLLVSGADDVASPGVDFESGFGAVNASSSLEILDAGNYLEENLDASGTFEFELEIPENTSEFRMSLAWIDPPAKVNDVFALQYDLDLRLVELSSGNEIKPWILNPFPSADSLQKIAVRGDDVLNNIELVTLDNPQAGVYKVLVTSKTEESFGHSFSLSYELEKTDAFRFTFPTSSDVIKTREFYFPRWESALSAGSGELQIRVNGGVWETIDQIDPDDHVYQWQALDSVVIAQFRMSVSGKHYDSDEFRITREARIRAGFNCDEDVLLFWNRQDSAISYRFFSLGDRFMELQRESADTSIILSKSDFANTLFAVQPVFKTGEGARSSAYDYNLLGSNCYFTDFFGFIEEDTSVRLQLNLSTTFNIERVTFSRNSSTGLSVIQEFPDPDSLELVFNDIVFPDGTNIYFSTIELEDGSVIETDPVEIFRPSAEFIGVYPNPAPAGFPVTIVTRGELLTIEILDQNGTVVFLDDLETINERAELPLLTEGVYFYRTLFESGQLHEGRLFVY